MHRRHLVLSAAAAGVIGSTATRAAGPAFDEAGFKAAQAAGRPILVAVHADWCPNCAKQKPIIGKLQADPRFAKMAFFVVDFDAEKELVRRFGARMQSTLIVFHGTSERARSSGETDAAKIEALLAQGLG